MLWTEWNHRNKEAANKFFENVANLKNWWRAVPIPESFCCLSYYRSIAFFQSEFSSEGDLVLPFSISSILSFP
jgi:hypothetical protein